MKRVIVVRNILENSGAWGKSQLKGAAANKHDMTFAKGPQMLKIP